jgi:hypothetical protein
VEVAAMTKRTCAFPVMLAAGVLLFLCNASRANETLLKHRCTIDDNRSPPLHTECVVRMSMAQGFFSMLVTIPDGKKYSIWNDEQDIKKIYIDNRAATQTSDDPETCYRSRRVEICIDFEE